MLLRDYSEFKKAQEKPGVYYPFRGLKVRTTSGFEGYLHNITKHSAVMTAQKCSPEATCDIHRVVGKDFDSIEDWTILEINSVPMVSETCGGTEYECEGCY